MTSNVSVGIPGHWIGVAFLKGDVKRFGDDVVMGATWGEMTHCEFVIGTGNSVKSYGAFTNTGFCDSPNQIVGPRWHLTCFPVKDHSVTYPFVLRALSLRIPYNEKDLWQCVMKAMLPFESELDCNAPETWVPHGVFCSQVCLLLLRKFCRDKVIACPPQLAALLESTHSRGCSPNTLFYTLDMFCHKSLCNKL